MPIIDKTVTFVKKHKFKIGLIAAGVVAGIAIIAVIADQMDTIADAIEDDSIEIIKHSDGSFTVRDAQPNQ